MSDDFATNTSNRGIYTLRQGTEGNGRKPGKVTLRFRQAGVFVYYCCCHSHPDDAHQPVSPGPDGGIQDANGNLGLPMSGMIMVLPGHDNHYVVGLIKTCAKPVVQKTEQTGSSLLRSSSQKLT